MVNHDFQTKGLSLISNQIMAIDRIVPTTMQTMQMVKHNLFRLCRFIMITLVSAKGYERLGFLDADHRWLLPLSR